jgi:hypothetical protein
MMQRWTDLPRGIENGQRHEDHLMTAPDPPIGGDMRGAS